MANFFKGIRFRLTLVYSTLFGLFLCIFAYVLSDQYFKSDRADFDSSLLNYAIDLSRYLVTDQQSGKMTFKIPKSEAKKEFPFIINKTFYSVRSLSGEILSRSSLHYPFKEIPYNPSLPLAPNYTHRFLTFKNQNDIFRAVNLKMIGPKDKELILQVTTPSNELEERQRNHLLITAIFVPFLIVVSSIISYLIAGNALGPIKSLTDTASNIAAQNLSLRVPEAGTGDEVDVLSKTLNNLLDRLEKSFKAQENFVANASHQLNTPLAIIKGELDLLETKGRTLEEHQKFHKSLREELERLIDLVKNMLLVSRVESGLQSFVFNPTRIDDLLLTLTSRLNTKAREKRIVIRFNIAPEIKSLDVMGERQLLDCLFENLLDNAIKYSPEHSVVNLEIKTDHDEIEVHISDQGPGIAPQNIELFFSHRFHRGEGITMPGSGIGLPFAAKIAEFHKAKISYERLQPQGSLFIVRFPKQNS